MALSGLIGQQGTACGCPARTPHKGRVGTAGIWQWHECLHIVAGAEVAELLGQALTQAPELLVEAVCEELGGIGYWHLKGPSPGDMS